MILDILFTFPKLVLNPCDAFTEGGCNATPHDILLICEQLGFEGYLEFIKSLVLVSLVAFTKYEYIESSN